MAFKSLQACPRHTISSSKWATRAWTFQEGLLSRRCLVFTSYETYFECDSMHWRESWSADFNQLHSHGRFRKFLDPGIFSGRSTTARSTIIRSPFKNLRRYYDLISEYSTKEFSYNYGEEDSLRAFIGIMNELKSGTVPVYQLWGLPLIYSRNTPAEAPKSFVASLLWRHKAGVLSRYRKPPERRLRFPSWSWSGWAGETVFPVYNVTQYKVFTSMVEAMTLEQDQGPQKIAELNLLSSEFDIEDCRLGNARALCLDAWVLLLPEQCGDPFHPFHWGSRGMDRGR
jgi:hypothetical protein